MYFQVSGIPDPNVEWLQNGEKILEGDRHNSTFSNGTAVLRITDSVPEDAGEYCCQATNSVCFEVSKETFAVSTQQPPVINGAAPEMDGHTSDPLQHLVPLGRV